jgi:hypothetical protein
MIRAQNRAISPKFPNHTFGVANTTQPPSHAAAPAAAAAVGSSASRDPGISGSR